MRAMKWLCIGLLATGCAVMMTACGDDDDDNGGGGTTTVVTNVVNGTTVVVTNIVPALVAPQLISPENNWSVKTLLLAGTGYEVNFQWTAVPGAAAYVFELDGVQTVVNGTARTEELGYGNYKWRVWARDANGGNGPASGKFKFSIKALTFPMPEP